MTDSTKPSLPNTKNRPLSPHLQIYKPQITSVLSITHRASGVGLCAGLVLFVAWIWSAAYCPTTFAWLQENRCTWWMCAGLIGWTGAFFFHFLNGIRHLGWDAGSGLSVPAATRSGWIVIVGTVFLTALVWSQATCPVPAAKPTPEIAAEATPAIVEGDKK